MKAFIRGLLLMLAWLASTGVAEAQLSFYTNNAEIHITGYHDGGSHYLVIPASTNGYPVTVVDNFSFETASFITNAVVPNGIGVIGDYAFNSCVRLKTISLPASVTNLGRIVFGYCIQMTNIAVDPANLAFTSVGGVLFDKAQKTLVEFPCGLGGNYVVPSSVTNIALGAIGSSAITGVSIPSSVINIGGYALSACVYLTNITVDPANPNYLSVGGVLFDKAQATLMQYPCALGSNYNVPAGVTSILPDAFAYSGLSRIGLPPGLNDIEPEVFYSCTNLASIVIPSSVTNISDDAFAYCTNLTAVYFAGNSPQTDPYAGSLNIFRGDSNVVYYLPGTTGWTNTFGQAPTALWNPRASAPNFADGTYGFNLTGPTNATIVIETCTNLTQAGWFPLATNKFSGSGTWTFNDSQAGSSPTRFYRMRSP